MAVRRRATLSRYHLVESTSMATKHEAMERETFPLLLTASLVSSLFMLDSKVVAVSLPAIGRSRCRLPGA
jgi:hypothetical protein